MTLGEKEAIRRWKQQLEVLRGRVKRMESVEETYGSRLAGSSEWIDTTAKDIERDKATIKILDDILKRHG